MDSLTLLLRGALIGLSVTAPIGPMGILCIHRTLAGGVARGLATGAGATTVQATYCTALLLGLHGVEPWMDRNSQAIAAVGGLLMLGFACTLMRRQGPCPGRRHVPRSLLASYLSAIALNGLNPMLLVLLMGAMSLVFGPDPPAPPDVVLLIGGLVAGSTVWWLVLNSITAMLRHRLNAIVLQAVNQATAGLLAVFSLLSLIRTMQG